MSDLVAGDNAPQFSLSSSQGGVVDLKSYAGKFVILYFYPKDDTPGCTKEACGFRDLSKEIAKANGVVFGVSMDSVASHVKFIEKYSLSFPLLSDIDGKVCKAYGVYKLKNMYGREAWGIERSTFLIDPSGKIAKVYRRVKVDGHMEAVLAELKEAAKTK